MLPELTKAPPPPPSRTEYIVERLKKRDTLKDIAADLGITRERVRQIADKAGVRVMRDFGGYGVSKEVRERRAAQEWFRKDRKDAKRARRKMQRSNVVSTLKSLSALLGRPATLKELSCKLGLKPASIVGVFYGRKNRYRAGTHYGRIGTARLYRLAGLKPWPPGHNPKTHPRGAESERSSNPPSM